MYQKAIDEYFTPANKARFMSLASSSPLIEGDKFPMLMIGSTNSIQISFGAPSGLLANNPLGPPRDVRYGRFHSS
jgi:hypothetical protein